MKKFRLLTWLLCMGLLGAGFAACDDDDDDNGGGHAPSGVEAVDLGLSVKWASCNVGTSSPEGYGGYYAWGETETKTEYTEKTYKYAKIDIGSEISGTKYDVAHVKWGGKWRMPTIIEIKELENNCDWTWTTLNGINGMRVTGPNGNTIFLPAAGRYYWDSPTRPYDLGSQGAYWSGSKHVGEPGVEGVSCLLFGSGNGFDGSCDVGISVRPVCDK